MAKKLFILSCGYFVRDVKAALDLEENIDDVQVITFPPDCGRPSLTQDNISLLTKDAEDGSKILILGSVCTAEICQQQLEKVNTQILNFEHCFHIICPPTIIDSALAKANYLLSPGWLAGWNKQIKKWGFDQQGTQNFLKESVNQLQLIDTCIDSNSSEQLKNFSKHVDIPSESLKVGLDYLRLLLRQEIDKWRTQNQLQEEHEQQKQTSNYAMSLELLAQLSKTSNETEVVDGIFELFIMLFAPSELIFIPYRNEQPGQPRGTGQSSFEIETDIPEFTDTYILSESGAGFWLRLERQEKLLGLLKIDHVTLPKYIPAYLNQALSIISVCALVIENARIQRKLIDTAHLAGKAELAIEVLHNVGNIVNSVNVSTQLIREQINDSVSKLMPGVIALIDEHRDNFGDFFVNDPRGQKLPEFFNMLNEEYEKEQNNTLDEINRLAKNIEHIKAIIRTQQVYSSENTLLESVNLEDIFNEVIQLYINKIARHNIILSKTFANLDPFYLSKHKLLQIVSNLVSNAIDSLLTINNHPRKIMLRITQEGQLAAVEVEDNGVGIANNDMIKIFQSGYTTKHNHSGFGLHSVSSLTKEIGGKLIIKSDGKDTGACFRLELPVNKNHPGQYDDS